VHAVIAETAASGTITEIDFPFIIRIEFCIDKRRARCLVVRAGGATPGFGAKSAYALNALNIDLLLAVPSNAEMEIPNEL